jgi:ABC-type multidrug transport system fused ATPase/permease subunit
MNTENAIKTAVGFFVLILMGTLIASVVGGVFGAVVALISPGLIGLLFDQPEDVVRCASAVGMIWGVFIGAAVSCCVCFLAAVVKIFRFRFERKADVQKEHV